eukprot:CAMPEP_0197023792 /NCGR_PEP_ID=MMETSP1384-20130603/4438_1 /TAXON_ID=29189 /ORGANISM="Ammonia sp." /LENGTH=370 /DNA_ID=CAMNT_0042452057 /DNA_START=93 /DNA_END=1205 /DNA_ORIENTATION=+
MDFDSKLDDVDDTFDMIELLMNMADLDEEILLEQRGYTKLSKLRDTAQGALYTASKKGEDGEQVVAIKRTSKEMSREKISIHDGFCFVVADDIQKEAAILQSLSSSKHPYAAYVAKYVDFFESLDDYYLVTAHNESAITLKQFSQQCHEFINQGKLSRSAYRKILKFVSWQLFVCVVWMHESKNVCHLDLNSSNILVENATFVSEADGTVTLRDADSLQIQISDFHVSETFDGVSGSKPFQCLKYGLNIEREVYLAPEVFCDEDAMYDARAADVWSLGIVMFECLTSQPPFVPEDVVHRTNGYLALHQGVRSFAAHLKKHNLHKYFTPKQLSFVLRLLSVQSGERPIGGSLLRQPWFASYYGRCQNVDKD